MKIDYSLEHHSWDELMPFWRAVAFWTFPAFAVTIGVMIGVPLALTRAVWRWVF